MKKSKIWSIVGSISTLTTVVGMTPLFTSWFTSCGCGCSRGNKPAGAYWINVTQSEGGKIFVEGNKKWAMPGEVIKFTVVAEPDYYSAMLQVNAEGINMMDKTEYTCLMPAKDLNVSGLFVSNENVVFDLYAGYTPAGADVNYFYMDGETPIRRYPFIAPKGLTFEQLTQYFPPIPTAGDDNKIFDRWYWWNPDAEDEYELGDPVALNHKFDTNPVVLIAGYTDKHEATLFDLPLKESVSSYNQQRFELAIKFDPTVVGAPSETKQFTTINLSDNYIFCDNIRDKEIAGKKSGWNLGLYENNTYQCYIDPISKAPSGSVVQFSFPFAPKTEVDVYFDMNFGFTYGGTTYTQKILNIHVVKKYIR